MVLKQVIDVKEIIDDGRVNGNEIVKLFESFHDVDVEVTEVRGEKGKTDFVKITIPGSNGKLAGGDAPTLGVVGRLGGLGARPTRIGLVSDGDGAIAAVSTAYKLALMQTKLDVLPGDVIVTTHICPDAPTAPHYPVDFMDSPVTIMEMNQHEITSEMDAILSIDTTKGNVIINHKGISISPTVKAGYVLKVNSDLVRIMEMATGQLANTFPVTTQDITPYGNDVYHVNSILQPSVATNAPVVGVAITTISAVPGCGTGASHEIDIADAVRFAIEVAKEFTAKKIQFYDEKEFAHLEKLYGSMSHLQTYGNVD
ncbi:DUF1177 domain-containing protein [Liquorilactobacillus cacaonum]|nr:DUF1177 domain-containing protein [Liquorilactobacillus cacaonum]